jgi:hypothetical protein
MKRPVLAAFASAALALSASAALLTVTSRASLASVLTARAKSSAPAPAAPSELAAPPAPAEPSADPAGTPPPPPSPGPAASASPKDAGPPPRSLTDDPPSAERTPRPKRAEWKDAPFVKLARATESGCKAKRIREWALIRCDMPGVQGISLIAGSRDGIDFWMNSMEDTHISVEFPMRRGDRRVFQVSASAGKYGSSPVAILSERWSEGDPAPLITSLSTP